MWRPVVRACTSAGLASLFVGRRAGSVLAEKGEVAVERGGSSFDFFHGLVRAGGVFSKEVALEYGTVSSALMLGPPFKEGGCWCLGTINWWGINVVLGKCSWSLMWTPGGSLPVDQVGACGVASALGNPPLGRAASGSPQELAPSDGLLGGACNSFPSPELCGDVGQGICFSDAGWDTSEVRGPPTSMGATPEVGLCPPTVRCSPRLALRDVSRVLDAAVARKARLRDSGALRSGARNSLSRKKSLDLSLKCGVRLSDGEADSLLEFASHGL